MEEVGCFPGHGYDDGWGVKIDGLEYEFQVQGMRGFYLGIGGLYGFSESEEVGSRIVVQVSYIEYCRPTFVDRDKEKLLFSMVDVGLSSIKR